MATDGVRGPEECPEENHDPSYNTRACRLRAYPRHTSRRVSVTDVTSAPG
jgi:hypothetical protein